MSVCLPIPVTLELALAEPTPGLPAVLAGRYAIGRELGRGGMATVYLARDLERQTDVAVKVLSPDLAPLLGAERFAREIRITSHLQHPNILPVLDSGQADGHPYYVMPFVDGESLAQRLRRESQLPIDQALDFTGQVADALAAAHEHGFVHRDIKPGNILLSDGRAMLADFGIARAIDLLTDEKLTESGVALGTATYMSPEQSSGMRVDGRSDIYSLGCVLFEMLAGSPPFAGGSSQSVRARHVVDPVPRIHTVRTTVTPSLEHVIDKAMAKVPADRYADARQFRDALRGVDLTDTTAIIPRRRRNRLIPIAAGVGALAVAAVGWRLMVDRSPKLDHNRIMVFPLVAPADFKGPRTIGEDVATMIGGALDGTAALRWIDAWPLLDPGQRDAIRSLTQASSQALARARHCAYFVTGRLIGRGDSVEVALELNDVAGDSTVIRGKSTGRSADAWRLGLLAVNELLPSLISGTRPDVTAEWNDRDPGVVADYLLGEAAFRRAQLGEALSRFRNAVKADSSFGLAAVRGAQAATWSHEAAEAGLFIRAALRQRLSPRYTHFALGYAAYLEGRADSAAAEFGRAIAIDPEMSEAWMQLGEVYTHLLPFTGRLDSLARVALETAHRIDPRATNSLLHLIEIRLRAGDSAGAAPLVRAFLDGHPDNAVTTDRVQLMQACIRGANRVDWRAEARRNLRGVLGAGTALSAAGAQLGCGMPALAEVVRADTSAAGDDRWFALFQLQAALLARGRTADAIAQVDARPRADEAKTMYLLDGPVFPGVTAQANAAAADYERQCPRGFRGCLSSYRLWELAVWAAYSGRPDASGAMAVELDDRLTQARSAGDSMLGRILAQSARAHLALAQADTSTALGILDSLLREAVPGGLPIEWNVALPRGLDRLVLARLLFAQGDTQRSIAVADVLDSPSPSIYLLYVPASLQLRAEAATVLGDRVLAARYQARLSALRGSRSLAVESNLQPEVSHGRATHNGEVRRGT